MRAYLITWPEMMRTRLREQHRSLKILYRSRTGEVYRDAECFCTIRIGIVQGSALYHAPEESRSEAETDNAQPDPRTKFSSPELRLVLVFD